MSVWDSYDFDGVKGKSVADYISDYRESLLTATKGHLHLNVDTCYGEYETTHRCFIVLPKLANYRRLIFEVKECEQYSYFPVRFENVINDESFTDAKFNENDIVYQIERVFRIGKRPIELLYRQSVDHAKDSL